MNSKWRSYLKMGFTERFVPSYAKEVEDPRLIIQVRLLVLLLLVNPFFGITLGIFYATQRLYLHCASFLGITLISYLGIYTIQKPGRLSLSGHIFVASIYSVLCLMVTTQGGIHSSSILFFPILPTVSYLFSGWKGSLKWLFICIVSTLTLFLVDVLSIHKFPVLGVNLELALKMYIIASAAMILYVVLLAIEFLHDSLMERARAEKARTVGILNSAADGILLLNEDGIVEDQNMRAQKLFGGDFRGKHIKELIPSWQKRAWGPEHLRKTVNAMEDRLEVQGHRNTMLEVSFGTIHATDDHDNFVLVARDVTHRNKARRELEKARDEAMEASVAKSRFLANMSHELRTPLNAIIGYSWLIRENLEDEGKQDSQEFKDLAKIETSGNHLLQLISDVLDLSKIEAGTLQLNKKTFSLLELLEHLKETATPLANKNGNTLLVEHNFNQDITLHTDHTKLSQILLNLLSNACKFTHDGTITLTCLSRRESIQFNICDTGIGIPEEKQEHIFDIFTQVDDSSTRTNDGAGLGLALCKKLAELLHGDVFLTESTEGEGSVFSLSIPKQKNASLETLLRQGELRSTNPKLHEVHGSDHNLKDAKKTRES